jgi:hypothetical protein
MSEESSIEALISLLEDPDEEVFMHVNDRLLELGAAALPALEENFVSKDLGELFRDRIEQLVHQIQLEESKRRMVVWFDSPAKDLLEGALIIARYQYPNLDEAKVRAEFEKLRRDCWLEMNPYLTAFEQVRIINRVLFVNHGFVGDSNFQLPANSYIHNVLENKKGNPLSLSIVYSIVAQMLDIPIYGVNLPNHFILAYLDTNGTNNFLSQSNEHGVLFYMNAFSKGSIFQKDEIENFLSKLNIPLQKAFFEPCSNSDILRQQENHSVVIDLTVLRDFLE